MVEKLSKSEIFGRLFENDEERTFLKLQQNPGTYIESKLDYGALYERNITTEDLINLILELGKGLQFQCAVVDGIIYIKSNR